MQSTTYNIAAPRLKSNQIYDAQLGCYVKKLALSTPMPKVKRIPQRVWRQLTTPAGVENKLLNDLQRNNIPVYQPLIRKGGVAEIKSRSIYQPFFSGNVFAALTSTEVELYSAHLLVLDISLADNEQRYAELAMMSMMERINEFYPCRLVTAITNHPALDWLNYDMTCENYGELKMFSNQKTDKVCLYFNYKTLNKIVKFDLTTIQFRSLLLSKIM